MDCENKILLKISLDSEDDYLNFRFVAEKALVELDFRLKKKLLICLTELIQNNIIHNQSSTCQIEVYSSDNQIFIKSKQRLSFENIKNIENKLSLINRMSIPDLEALKRINIIKAVEENRVSPGNGLIICRIKSENKIDLNIINGTKKNNSEEINIFVKTNFNGKDN